MPYDCDIAVGAHPEAGRSTFGVQTSSLIDPDHGPGDPSDKVPELSRRARGGPVWAALQQLGRTGVVNLVDRPAATAVAIADGAVWMSGSR